MPSAEKQNNNNSLWPNREHEPDGIAHALTHTWSSGQSEHKPRHKHIYTCVPSGSTIEPEKDYVLHSRSGVCLFNPDRTEPPEHIH